MSFLDAFDYSILEILQQNNLTSQSEIGNRVGLSAPAVQRRIKKLREAGVIKEDVSLLDPEIFGSIITIVTEVKMEADKFEFVSKAKAMFLATPQIQQCYYVTGGIDFILIINVFSMKEYEALTQELFFKNDYIKQFKTCVTMDVVKRSLSIPLDRPSTF